MKILRNALLLLPALLAGAAHGQGNFPTKPINLFLAGGPGTTMDTTMRMFSTNITQRTGHPIVIDYRGGAGGTIGAAFIAKQPPDGHSIMGTISSYVAAPSLYPNLSYDPIKDLAPVTMLTEYFFIVVVNPKMPVRNLGEYLKYLQANPGKVNFGTSGQGSSYHMAGALLHHMTNTKVTYIHYKTGTQRQIDFTSGRLDAQFATPRSYEQDLKAGKTRGLAITSTKRLDALPDMPTVAESGVPGYEFSSWNGILAPGRTPAAQLNALHKLFADAGKDPEVAKKMEAVEQMVVTTPPEEFRRRIGIEIPKWREVIKAANITLDGD